MRNENKERKERRKGKKRKTVRREKKEGKGERRKGKRNISRLSDGRSSTVRGLKLVHAARSTCGHQKFEVSTNSKR